MSIFSAAEITRRQDAVRAALGEGEAAVVFSFTETYYLSGAPLSRWGRPYIVVLPRDGDAVAVLAEQERPRVAAHSPIGDLRTYADADGPSAEAAVALLAAVLEERGVRRIAVDGRGAPVGLIEALRARRTDLSSRDLTGTLEALRVISSAEEIAYLRTACAIADHGMRTYLAQAAVGVPEVVLAGRAQLAMAEHAAAAFPEVEVSLKVYSQQGARSVQPHTAANGEPLAAGQLMCVVIEVHAWGYQAAVERALRIGDVAAHVAAFHETIAAAQAAGIAAVRPGVACGEIDRVCRAVFAAAGHHAMPCGAGLVRNIISELEGRIACGELRRYNDTPLQPGMMLTVEPWAVEPSIGAPRNCDMVLVTEHGHEVISRTPPGPLAIG